ncbi:MAG: ribonuclease D [Robiginitomaculum sp.]|nr:MAG: ribonuclease D [Robiginitomaculum sp.]
MKIITTTDSLAKFCKKAKSAPFIALDTEFMRERTFYSQLCLIQMATPDDEAILDPLAKGIDLSPFLALLADKKLEKVMHAARQDMEIFYKLINAVPTPIFDTQIAAMALGFGENVGYLALVKGRLAITLDKGARFTDWARRPLSDSQLSYALGDVTHLRDLYPGMCRELNAKNRMDWVREEMETMMDVRLYDFDPEQAWKRLKPRMFRQDYLAALKAAAAWRESEAQTKDVPRGRILKDDGLYVIAQRKPKNVKELADVRGIPGGFANRKTAVNLIDDVQKAIANSASYAPEATRAKQMPPGLGPSVDMLKTLLRLKTEYVDIAPRLIANVSDLTELAAFGEKANVRALKGWRREVFGEDALKMLNGEISLTLKDKKVVAVSCVPHTE